MDKNVQLFLEEICNFFDKQTKIKKKKREKFEKQSVEFTKEAKNNQQTT